jgi:hypothetical protein
MNIILLVVLVSVVVLAFILRKQPIVEKYWKWSLAAIPFIVLMVLDSLKKKPETISIGKENVNNPDSFSGKIQDVKESVREANTVAEIKTDGVKKDEQKKLDKLDDIVSQPNPDLARKNLVDYLNSMN